MSAHPFTIFEAEVRLFTVTSEGEIDARQWIGACVETLEIEPEYEELAVQYPGCRHARTYHADESRRITMTNVAAIDTAPPARTVQLERNREYALVVVWHDREAGFWLKRCFLGVKAQPAALTAQNIYQRLRFTAEDDIEIAGSGTRPAFDLVRHGEVFYVGDDGERVLFYRFDALTRDFTATPEADADLAEIVVASSGELTITIGGAEALMAGATGVEVGRIIATGGTLLADRPRLEFYTGSTRCASLSADRFVAPSLRESAIAPGASANVEFFNPGWLFSFTGARAVAPEFFERTL